MKMKCESCLFYARLVTPYGTSEYCGSDDMFIASQTNSTNFIDRIVALLSPREEPIYLEDARDICDREGDGHFVYFEERDPEPGAGAAFVQITHEKPPQAQKAAA